MEEQNQMPQNIPANQNNEDKKNNVPTIFGVILIIILVGTVAFFVLRFAREKNEITATPIVNNNSQTKETSEGPILTESEKANPIEIPNEPQAGANGNSIDFNYEIEQLDDRIGSIKEDDFNETEFSDSDLGV